MEKGRRKAVPSKQSKGKNEIRRTTFCVVFLIGDAKKVNCTKYHIIQNSYDML